METLKRSDGPSKLAYLDTIVPYLFALGCARAWMTLAFAAPAQAVAAPFDPHVVFDYAYCLLALAIALTARRVVPFCSRRWTKPAALLGMLGASICLVVAQGTPFDATGLLVAGGVAGGVGFSVFLLLWAETIGALSLIRIVLYTAASTFMAVIIVFFCEGFDELRGSIALVVLPVAAVASVAYANRALPASERQKPTYPRFSYPWKLFALFAVYSFAYGLRQQQLAAGAGMHSSLSTALTMAALFAFVLLLSQRVGIGVLYRSPLLLMVCGFLLIPAESLFGANVSSYLISMSYSLMTVLVSLLLYDISKRLGIAVVALASVKSVEQVFIIWGNDAANALAQLLPTGVHETAVTGLVAVLVLVATFILYSERELTSKWGVSLLESGGLIERSAEEERLEARCDEIAKRYRLSPREDEILRLIARGKTGPAIERELFIAEGTFKAHTRHIYEKMGINSRKQLRDIIGVDDGERPERA